MREQIVSPVGFADSSLERYERNGNELVVHVRCWNEALVRVTFGDVLSAQDFLAGDFSGFVKSDDASLEFFESSLKHAFENIPSSHSYSVYSFLDHDDEPSLTIVAAKCALILGS